MQDASEGIEAARIWAVSRNKNDAGYSPLTLAASTNNVLMFFHLMFTRRTKLWVYGPLSCFSLDLELINPR